MKPIFLLVICLIIGFSYTTRAQKILPAIGAKPVDPAFTKVVTYFDQLSVFRKDTIRLPLLLESKDYKVILADSALPTTKHRRVLTNPFSADKYPLSYSVLYQNCLVSLFDPGHFACYTLDGWRRNLLLEKRLNTKRFERHWLINGQLIGLASGTYWQFNQKDGWQAYSKAVPFKERPKLFEDSTYLVYDECKGEFGGRVFFFDKQTQKTYWTESTCAVWIRHTPQGYEILSSLGHMMGGADKQIIPNPRSLPEWTGQPARNKSMANETNKPIVLFDFYGLQLFGGLERNKRVLYLAHLNGRTCLASLTDHTFTLVDPLFDDGLYTHQPVTTDYKDVYLINLDFYGIGLYREVACLVLKNDQITLLDWHEFHTHR